MPIEGLRKHTTTLFTGVLSSQVTSVSRVLENHRNLTNHQLCMTAGAVLSGGTYAVYIMPDAEQVRSPVNTGLIIDLTGKDSALLTFNGVIKGIILQSIDPVPEASVRMSAVMSSYSRQKRTGMEGSAKERLDYVSSDLGAISSTAVKFSTIAENHSNLVYHQLALSSDVPLEGSYRLRFIPDGEGEVLETTVDTGRVLDFANTASALMRFGGIIKGIHLTQETPSITAGEIRIVLSSAVERFDELVNEYIGSSWDDLSDAPTEDGWLRQDAGVLSAKHWPYIKIIVEAGETAQVPVDNQMLIHNELQVDGDMDVNGELVIF